MQLNKFIFVSKKKNNNKTPHLHSPTPPPKTNKQQQQQTKQNRLVLCWGKKSLLYPDVRLSEASGFSRCHLCSSHLTQGAHWQILANSGSTHSKPPLRLKIIMTVIESRLDCSTLALHTEKMSILVTMRKKRKDIVSIKKKQKTKH